MAEDARRVGEIRHGMGKESALGPASRMLVPIGAGCYLGWQTIGISPTLFPSPLPRVDEALDACGYAATALLLLLLLGLASLARRRPGMLVERRGAILLACLGPALGTAVLHLSGWVGAEAHIAGVVAGRLLFATSAGLVVLWGELLSACGAAHVLGCTAGSYAVSFGICLVEACLSPDAALALRPAMPLLSGAALLALRKELVDGRDDAAAPSDPQTDRHAARPPLSLKPFVATGALGAVFIATNHLSETKTAVSTELYTLVAGICVSLAILAAARLTQGRVGGFSRLYRLITPLVIGCLLFTLVLEPGSQHYEALAIGGAWAFFRVFTWTLWARIGERDPKGGAFVFAVGQIALTTCSTASEILCLLLNLPSLPLVGTAAAIIGATVLVSVFLLEDGEMVKRLEAEAAQKDPEEAPDGAPRKDPGAVTLEEMALACRELGLSEREREISLLVFQGNGNAFICETACITESTLRTHLRNIYSKTGTHSREELISLLEVRVQALC